MSNLKTEQKLLTHAWIDDAAAITNAMRTFTARRALPNPCHVVLFELAGDRELHVNVIHQQQTTSPAGWSGPGITPDGFVHNRRFGCNESASIARHIRDMVFAPRHRAAAAARGPVTA